MYSTAFVLALMGVGAVGLPYRLVTVEGSHDLLQDFHPSASAGLGQSMKAELRKGWSTE